MKALPSTLLLGMLLVVGATARAADAAPASTPAVLDASAAESKASNEPYVKRTVIDDSRARIEELRVRGQLQKVTVAPKGNAPSYEVLTGDGSRDLTEGSIPSRNSPGKRVWNVLRF